MLTITKISAMALIAIVALPPYSHELAVAPSDPPAALRDAVAGAQPPDPLRQAGAPQDEQATQANDAVAYSQSALPDGGAAEQKTSPGARAPAPPLPAKLPLEIGDNLKIGFFETISMGSNGQSGKDGEPQGALRTFYQRMDLSGDYTVEQDGTISIPLLGRFRVEGRALDDIRADLALSFTSIIGRSANIDVKILDRAPVYVVGQVKNPGAYKYVPGMIVLQAIALAGGLDRGPENLSGMIEGAREMARLRIANLQVDQLLARRARLEAERDGYSALMIPVQLAKADQDMSAGTFLASENGILHADQAKRRHQDQDIALRVASERNEVSALKRKLDQFNEEKGLRLERLDAMQKLKDRGVATSNNVLMLRTELADIEARRQDNLVAVVQAETRLARAQADSAKLTSENTADLAKEIATVDSQIAAAREEATSARVLAALLYRPSSASLQAQAYEIVRQSKDGAKSLQATETSPLMPGDVLKINPNNASAVTPSGATSAPPSPLTPPFTRTSNEN